MTPLTYMTFWVIAGILALVPLYVLLYLIYQKL